LTSGPRPDRAPILSTPPRRPLLLTARARARDGTSPWRPATRPSHRLRPTAPARPPPAPRR
jgi:hypothetical protein